MSTHSAKGTAERWDVESAWPYGYRCPDGFANRAHNADDALRRAERADREHTRCRGKHVPFDTEQERETPDA